MAFEKSEVRAVKLTARNVLNKSRGQYWTLEKYYHDRNKTGAWESRTPTMVFRPLIATRDH